MFRLNCILIVIFICLTTGSVSSLEAATLSVSPDNQEVEGGEDADVEIVVRGASGLMGFQFTLTYNSEILDVIEASLSEGISASLLGPKHIDLGNGEKAVRIGGYVMSGRILSDDDEHSLVRLNFKALRPGISNLALSEGALIGEGLTDMSIVYENGMLQVKELAYLSVTAPPYDTTIKVGEEFEVKVEIEKAYRMKGFQCGIMYDPELLEFKGLTWEISGGFKLGPKQMNRSGGYISQIIGLVSLGRDAHYTPNGERQLLVTARLVAKREGTAGLLLDRGWAKVLVKDDSPRGFHEIALHLNEGRINIIRPNHPPELNSIGDKSVNENEVLEFTVSASDTDGDTLNYSASNLPQGARFEADTHRFTWRPAYDQAGEYDVTFAVSDEEFSDEETVQIEVNETVLTAPCNSPAIKIANRSERWYEEGTELYTFWAGEWVEYNVDFQDILSSGKYFETSLTAKNRGRIPKRYSSFRIAVYVDGNFRGRFNVPARQDRYNTGRFSLGVLTGVHVVRFVWENDYYVPGRYDANIQIKEVGFNIVEVPVYRGSISGKVYEITWERVGRRFWRRFYRRRRIRPLAGASVTLSGGDNREVITDTQGRYSIDKLAEGRYRVTASKQGYRTQSRNVRLKKDQNLGNINFYLSTK